MYSPKLYKYRDFYVLYIPTVHAFGWLLLTLTLLKQTHIHDVFAPLGILLYIQDYNGDILGLIILI